MFSEEQIERLCYKGVEQKDVKYKVPVYEKKVGGERTNCMTQENISDIGLTVLGLGMSKYLLQINGP